MINRNGGGLLILGLLGAVGALADSPTSPPQLTEPATPIYSETLRAAGISGQVVVQFGVDATGAVQNITVFKSDHAELEAPAMEAVRKWKFKPATKDGQPVATPMMKVPIDFNLEVTAFRAFPSFKAALTQAEQEHKIIFIDFFTTWCEPCKRMDKDTWQNPAVIALLKEKTIALKIDAEKNVPMAEHYGVNAYPTLALIRADGTLIESLVGYRDAATFSRDFADTLAGTKLAQAQAAVAKAGADPEQLAKTRHDLGRELAQKGENAEALTEYLWCFDVGMKPPSSYGGVRMSFLLEDIAALGAHYQPALDALKTRRDEDKKKLWDDRGALSEFGAINHYLGEDNLSLASFDQFPAGSPARVALGYWLFDILIEAKRYRDALDAVPADRYQAVFNGLISAPNQDGSSREYVAESAGKEIEALAGSGKTDGARDLLKALFQYDHSEATMTAVRAHLGRAGHADMVLNYPSDSKTAPAPAAGQPPAHP
jgi:TonB family protein